MDCRNLLILGLGVLASAGCSPGSKKNVSQPDIKKENITPAEAAARKPEKELPKRKPKAQSCVAYGDFRLRESQSPLRSPQEQSKFRDEARQGYTQALELDPNCIEAHLGLARIHSAEKNYAKATASLESILKTHPKEASVWFELGMCHCYRKDWQPAIDSFTQAVNLDPDNQLYTNIFGYCLALAGQFEECFNVLSRTRGEAMAHAALGRIMVRMGQVDGGKEHLQAALKIDPDLKEAKDELTKLETGAKSDQPILPVQFENAESK